MLPTHPLPLHHSWPLCDLGQRFDLGWLDDRDAGLPGMTPSMTVDASAIDTLDRSTHSIGRWDCDLIDNRLTWSPVVYDIFALPRDACPTRAETVGLYCEGSRAAMERLRAYAIKHRRGFTLDAEILPDRGGRRWMRLIAAPVCADGRVVRLHGLKRDVSHLYP